MDDRTPLAHTNACEKQRKSSFPSIELSGGQLQLEQVESFLSTTTRVVLPGRETLLELLQPSIDCLDDFVANKHHIYGVNTLFGGLANHTDTGGAELQDYLIKSHMVTLGDDLDELIVKLTMLLRANSLLKGASSVRPIIVERLVDLINLDVTPRIKDLGSIGASGDLIPLSAMAGAAFGLSDAFELKYQGQYRPAPEVLKELELAPIQLEQKEGLALINGTSCHTAITLAAWVATRRLFAVHLRASTLIAECLYADRQTFHPFIHKMRPHPGQIKIAQVLFDSLSDSALLKQVNDHNDRIESGNLIQDRYSIRCIPQFLGPLWEDLNTIGDRLAIELNSASDNPLIDVENHRYFFGGNFLGQNIALDADKLRIILCLLAKHNEAHIAYLVDPQVNRGLPASLALLRDEYKTIGVKPLQIASNSIVPLLEQAANPMVTHFPIHAEQGNQNLNSQAFGSANLTRRSVDLFAQQLSITLLIAAQAASLRALSANRNTFDELFSHSSSALLHELYSALGVGTEFDQALLNYQTADRQQKWVQKIMSTVSSTHANFLDIDHKALFRAV